MFKRLPESGREPVKIRIEDQEYEARTGESVAAAVLAAGIGHCRTTAVSGAPRAPFCMMGVCFECLVEIDGVPNQQACMIPVRAGMTIRRQAGPRRAEP